ncbi:MAG: 4a-hydroxytetrahydrobiopterin dehydratase [Candidatus Zambryskibacteria bacterium]|nr:4a-hydroxytetrahydrobiopterin dehydratase [Candidatus Zambryskibacteria bacterium]
MEKPKILTQEEIELGLKSLPGWTYAGEKISKEYKFADFLDAFNFVSSLVPYFEKMDHHPDIHIFYNRIVFELQRFDIGGKVTDRDLMVAGEIDKHNSSR